MTSAPAGSKVKVGGDDQWLAGCSDFYFATDVAGTYAYEVAYNGGTYTGTVTAAAPAHDTAYVMYNDAGSSPNSFSVKVGEVIVFEVGTLVNCADQVYLFLTSVPYGASNPVPAGTGYAMDINGHPLIYPVTVAGTYSFSINGTSGYPGYAGSITATASEATAAVQTTAQSSGLSMTVNPAPSNGTAMITFTSDKPRDLQLALFDATGKQVHAYENVKLSSGEYSLPLSSTTLPNGDYFLRAISAGEVVATAKVMIVH